jgi:phage shock protein C
MTASPAYQQPSSAPSVAPSGAQPRIFRSRTDRVFAGVCGGLAERYGADPTAVRLLAVILAVFTGIVPLLILYLIAAAITPERGEGEAPSVATAARPIVTPGRGGLIAGIVLMGVGILALANEWYGIDWSVLWPVAVIVVGGTLVVAARR